MSSTFQKIIQDSVKHALGLPSDPIQTDVRDMALSMLNSHGSIIWFDWPFDNEKIDEFTAPTPDADGIIIFDATVESVRAVRGVSSSDATGGRIYNQNEILAANNGETVGSDRFIHLSDSTATLTRGCRRIRVDTSDTSISSRKVLALKRWIDATVEVTYSAVNPSLTPTDYRYMLFPLDRAEQAVRSYLVDALRRWRGLPPLSTANVTDGSTLVNKAVQRETYDNDRERRSNPMNPMFEEMGGVFQ